MSTGVPSWSTLERVRRTGSREGHELPLPEEAQPGTGGLLPAELG